MPTAPAPHPRAANEQVIDRWRTHISAVIIHALNLVSDIC